MNFWIHYLITNVSNQKRDEGEEEEGEEVKGE